MKLKRFTLPLTSLIVIFLFFSCSDSIEPIDDSFGETEEEIVNDETSTDDDTDTSSDDDTMGDSTDSDTDGGDTSGDDSDTNTDDTTGGDDTMDGGDDTSSSIVGDWRLVSATVENGEASTVFNGVPLDFPFTSNSADEDVDITFQENPNIIEGTGQYTNIIEFTILGQNFTEETTFDSPLTNGTWEMPNDQELVVSGSDQANGTFIINELTDTSLILQIDFEQTVPTNDLELDVTGILVVEFVRN